MVNKFVYGIYVVNSRSYWNSCHALKEISQLFMTSLSLCCRRFHNCYMKHMTQGAYATMSGFLTGYTWTKARHIPLDLFQQWEALLVLYMQRFWSFLGQCIRYFNEVCVKHIILLRRFRVPITFHCIIIIFFKQEANKILKWLPQIHEKKTQHCVESNRKK